MTALPLQEQENLELNEAESSWIDTFSALDSKVNSILVQTCGGTTPLTHHTLTHYSFIGISNYIFRKQRSSRWTRHECKSPNNNYHGDSDSKCRRFVPRHNWKYQSFGGHFPLGGNTGGRSWRLWWSHCHLRTIFHVVGTNLVHEWFGEFPIPVPCSPQGCLESASGIASIEWRWKYKGCYAACRSGSLDGYQTTTRRDGWYQWNCFDSK